MSKFQAVVYDQDGYVIREDDLLEWAEHGDAEADDGPFEVVVVTDTALPVPQSPGSEFHRSPGSYRTLDCIFQYDVSASDSKEVLSVWERAKMIADALNAWKPE